MSDWPATALRTFVRRPGWQLVVGGAVLALAFPSRLAGTIGTLILLGAAGIGVAALAPRVPQLAAHARRYGTAIVLLLVSLVGLNTFWDTLALAPDWQIGDWGPQHAVLSNAIDAFPGLDLPVWNHLAGTGDAPFELYSKVAYLVTGNVAVLLGMEHELPHAYMVVAVLVHLGLVLGTTALAARVAPRPIALAVGCMAMLDSGAVAEGGTVDLFRWALLHSVMALAFFMIAALGVTALYVRPRWRAAIAIWVGSALAAITHPAGLLVVIAAMVALLAVALLASDAPPRRALVAIGHLGLGAALGAIVWLPLGQRLLAYGQHFPNALLTGGQLLLKLIGEAWPTTAFGLLVYAGYFGILAGLWSRRAVPVFLASTALVLLVGTSDVAYSAFDLAPGFGVSRLGAVRLTALARPFLAAAGAYGFAVIVTHACQGWRGASPQRRMIAAAIAGILTGACVRAVPDVWRASADRAFNTTRRLAPDPGGRAQLVTWGAARARELRPDAWARALVETDTHEHFHLTALTGLPTFHLAPQPQLLLRERIEDTSPASLRRFNVRWVIAQGQSPTLGDPATEVVLGSFHVRELPAWDGAFARIERGTGTVRTVGLDREAVTIEVTGTEPVLVALGTGYYPRWRAHHASGAVEPVFALPTIEGGRLHVVSAWVAPGRTTFTCDGPLPSDGAGTWLTALALVLLVGTTVAWRVRRFRHRVLRRLAEWGRELPRLLLTIARAGVPLLLVVLAIRGCVDDVRPALALEVGSGLRGTATVEARFITQDAYPDENWQTCAYDRLAAQYRCDRMLVVYDAMGRVMNDALPSWPFNTPAITASAHLPGIEMRLRVDLRLAGTYWLGVSAGSAELAIGRERPRTVTRETTTFVDRGVVTLELRSEIPTDSWQFALVRESTLVPARPELAPPPAEPPFAVRALATSGLAPD